MIFQGERSEYPNTIVLMIRLHHILLLIKHLKETVKKVNG